MENMSVEVSANLEPWELASEAIAVKIRWFGLILGYLYINFGSPSSSPLLLNAIMTFGLGFTLFDTWYSWRGQVFLGYYPLAISCMEAIFIGLLCYFDTHLNSPFRFYYLLSLICCAIRSSSSITYITCALDCLSYSSLFLFVSDADRNPFTLILMLTVLVWVSWAANALSKITRQLVRQLRELNSALQENQSLLETRIIERTRELNESQAQVMHQDKMAGFGLLAAGIAHEVGNPLTSISSLLQILEKRNLDEYTRSKLGLIAGQLNRIQGTLRELMNFSRPVNPDRTRFEPKEIVEEALHIAKYYKGIKSRTIESDIAEGLPQLTGIRDQLVQIIFNLVLNAIDATSKGGLIRLEARRIENVVEISIRDNGVGMSAEQQSRLFQPYFTTKKQGTGLGLFISAKMIRAHGGDLSFESTLNQGTIFRITIPTREWEPQSVPPQVLSSSRS
jgi:signal transduction histidine kinase